MITDPPLTSFPTVEGTGSKKKKNLHLRRHSATEVSLVEQRSSSSWTPGVRERCQEMVSGDGPSQMVSERCQEKVPGDKCQEKVPGTTLYLERGLPGSIQGRPESQVTLLYGRPGGLALLLHLARGTCTDFWTGWSPLTTGQVQITGVALLYYNVPGTRHYCNIFYLQHVTVVLYCTCDMALLYYIVPATWHYCIILYPRHGTIVLYCTRDTALLYYIVPETRRYCIILFIRQGPIELYRVFFFTGPPLKS